MLDTVAQRHRGGRWLTYELACALAPLTADWAETAEIYRLVLDFSEHL